MTSAAETFVIVRKSDGKAVLETADQALVSSIDGDKYDAIPIREYLAGLNTKREA